MRLILSLFPGADLLGKAFEAAGFCVVHARDILTGGDIRDFHAPPGKFDGVIGGPPCQSFSTASVYTGTRAINLIPEFLRVIEEAQPRFAVMENVRGVLKNHAGPDWSYSILRDFDCGGLTHRRRVFWFYGIPPAPAPVKRQGAAAWSVLASNFKKRYTAAADGTTYFHGHVQLSAHEAAKLQGFPELADKLTSELHRNGNLLPKRDANNLAVHLLGNGVPRALGDYVARHVVNCLDGRDSYHMTGLPLFAQDS